MKNECFAYLRVSGKDQVDRDGFTRQRKAIEAWAAATGYEVAREFAEEGVTGEADGMDRPAFADMVCALAANGTRTVVVENLTRLARSFVIQDSILSYLASKGFELISADNGENITEAMRGDPIKRAIIQMMAVFSEYEKAALVAKLKAARARRKAQGFRVEGRPCYGEYEGEREIIERMKEIAKEKYHGRPLSMARIADRLNEEGIVTRNGKKWLPCTVYRILKREREAAARAAKEERAKRREEMAI